MQFERPKNVDRTFEKSAEGWVIKQFKSRALSAY